MLDLHREVLELFAEAHRTWIGTAIDEVEAHQDDLREQTADKQASYARAHYLANREAVKAASVAWQKANRARYLDIKRAYYQRSKARAAKRGNQVAA